MTPIIEGLHHVTAISGAPQRNLDFYAKLLGLRFVKRTVNFDDPSVYHLYYGNEVGAPGTVMTFFPWERMGRGRPGIGETSLTQFAVPPGSLPFWRARLEANGALVSGETRRFGEESLLGEDPDGLKFALVVPADGDEGEAAVRSSGGLGEALRQPRVGDAGQDPAQRPPPQRGVGDHGRPGLAETGHSWDLEGAFVDLARADADDRVDLGDPHLAVADATGAGGGRDHRGHVGCVLELAQHLDPRLGDDVDGVLGAPVHLRLASLAAEARALGDGHALDAVGAQGLLHLVELVRLDDGGDELHRISSASATAAAALRAATSTGSHSVENGGA